VKKLKLFRTALHAVIVMFVVSGIIACSSSSDSSVSEGEDSQLSSFRPARIDVDNGNDGTIDETFNLFYDAQGFLIRELIDVGADGNMGSFSARISILMVMEQSTNFLNSTTTVTGSYSQKQVEKHSMVP